MLIYDFSFLLLTYLHYKNQMHKLKEKDRKSRSREGGYCYNFIPSFFKECARKAKARQ
jgi:hypothetical protein